MSELDIWAQRAWLALEAVHVSGYFSRECRQEYEAIGLPKSLAYFPARSAPLGMVPAEVVEATFYVFAPRVVRMAVPACWQAATPEQVLAARYRGVARTLHGLLDDLLDPAELDEAVQLARRACEGLAAPGRPLYAGHASLPWPADPLLQLWHAATLLREHRGDGHIAALTAADLGPVEASLTAVLAGGRAPLAFLKRTRGWTDAEWTQAADRLRERGLAEDGDVEGVALTPAGRELRERVEATTDRAALSGWAHLGADRTRRLAELAQPWGQAVAAAGLLPGRPPAA